MLLDEYQEEAVRTAIYNPKYAIMYPSLGLSGEVGEFCGKISKVYRDNDGVFSEEIKKDLFKEAGDIAWFLAAVCRDLGFNLDSICQANLVKLKNRQLAGTISGSGDNR